MTSKIRGLAVDFGKGEVWIEKVRLLTTDPASRPTSANVPDDALSEVASLFQQIRDDSSRAGTLGFDLGDVVKKLPAELKDLARLDDDDWLSEVLAAAEPLLHSRLMGTEVDE